MIGLVNSFSFYKKARELHDEIKENKMAGRKTQKWESGMRVGWE